MSTELHAEIRRSRELDSPLWKLLNARKGAYGLVNGQLVEYGRPVRDSNGEIQLDETKVARFVPMRRWL